MPLYVHAAMQDSDDFNTLVISPKEDNVAAFMIAVETFDYIVPLPPKGGIPR
jgi:hypothetical protein